MFVLNRVRTVVPKESCRVEEVGVVVRQVEGEGEVEVAGQRFWRQGEEAAEAAEGEGEVVEAGEKQLRQAAVAAAEVAGEAAASTLRE